MSTRGTATKRQERRWRQWGPEEAQEDLAEWRASGLSLGRFARERGKKWQGQVGAPRIQTFMGALQLQGADKGVLITSGTISGPAYDAARQARGSVVLIDGVRLAELMIEHGVRGGRGVSADSEDRY